MSTTEATGADVGSGRTTPRTITLPDGVEEYVSLAIFCRDPERFAEIAAEHDADFRDTSPRRDRGKWLVTKIASWDQNGIAVDLHGPVVEVDLTPRTDDLRGEADR